jgi:uncharacterized protein YqjF (DUF2071 family)
VNVGQDFNAEIVNVVAHRPWPLPDRPWLMTQTWNDLLFAHWPVEPRDVRSRLPSEFELDLFDGSAWIGIVPFYMTNVGPRGLPSLPWVSQFPELNVRTYASVADRPGVYFFSLDAGSSIAAQAARTLFNLPYHAASISISRNGRTIGYESRRANQERPAHFRATYEPAGDEFVALKGSLEYFLTERYCLYHRGHRGVPYRLEIHHPPWKLQPARAQVAGNDMANVNGLALPQLPPLLHFARRQDVVAWAPRSIDAERAGSPP